MRLRRTIFLATAMIALAASGARADTINILTTNDSGTINGAYFVAFKLGAGTGQFNPFLTLGSNSSTEQGYNTDNTSQPLDDVTGGTRTHSVQLSSFGIANRNGVNYYQIFLDSNEAGAAGKQFIDLTKFQVWLAPPTSTGQDTNYNTTANTWNPSGYSLIYDLNATGQGSTPPNSVHLDSTISNGGSGDADLIINVPVTAFTAQGASANSFIVVYAQFTNNDAGFEEFKSSTTPVTIPEPSSYILMTLGLFGLAHPRVRKALSRKP